MATLKTITNPIAWEKFVTSHPESNFLQSYYHGQTHEALGKKVHYLGIFEGQALVGVCLGIIEDAKRGRYLSIPGGPLLNWENQSLVKSFFEQISEVAKKDRCIFIRLRPQIEDTEQNRLLMKKNHLKPSPMHLTAEHTLQLNLNQSPEIILAQMRKTTRYEIRQAEKLGIKVISTTDIKAADEFYDAQIQTAKRQKFVPFSLPLIRSEFSCFTKHNQALLYKAVSPNGKPLAYALIIHYPTESSYHFGASTEEGRRLPGAYAILWQAIRDAQKLNIPRFNFWGIVGENQTKHRFYGVSVFKRGFGGQEVKYIPAHDLVLNSLRYLPIYLFETARKKIRRL
jgi:lipid II:glycine glycyltransferase (peptidoglycan interpeptide bridge formation enzyme)